MRKVCFLVFIVLLFTSMNVTNDPVSVEKQSLSIPSDYVVHSPILINSDNDFETQGWPGEGSVEDPYVIEGLMIAGPFTESQAAIRVNGVSASFVIRNCVLYDLVNMTSPKLGIVVPFSNHVIIEGNVFDAITDWGGEMEQGINVVDGTNMTIIGNRISNCNGHGIWDGNGYLYDSIVSGNIVSNCSSDNIRISGGARNEITNNVVSDFQSVGILGGCSNSVISGNRISSNEGTGLRLDGNDNAIFNNTIYGCYQGIYADRRCELYNNTMKENVYGLWLPDPADRSNITWNSFVNNNFSVHNDADPVLFDYNYWSDYDGLDADYNGIGDTPYENFFENVVDNHPLMYYPWYEPVATTLASTTILGIVIGVGVVISVIVLVVLKKK